jgi:Uma2 family endonuclease
MRAILRSSARQVTTATRRPALPPLVPGERLDQKTFHARYQAMPPDTRAELIEGIVYMPSPLKLPHSRKHGRLMHFLYEYQDATPGTEAHDNATAIMGDESEPQPDGCLLIVPAYGGQTREEDDYMVGAPEFVSEVAFSTADVDLHAKLRDYERAGVKEYVVVVLKQNKLFWFRSRQAKFLPVEPDRDGIFRSQVFPGLWLDPEALLRQDVKRLKTVLREGLASAEHKAFVAELAKRAAKRRTRRK